MKNKKETKKVNKKLYHLLAFCWTILVVLDTIANSYGIDSLFIILFLIIFNIYCLVYFLEVIQEKTGIIDKKEAREKLEDIKEKIPVHSIKKYTKLYKKYNLYAIFHIILIGAGFITRLTLTQNNFSIFFTITTSLILTHWGLDVIFRTRDNVIKELIK